TIFRISSCYGSELTSSCRAVIEFVPVYRRNQPLETPHPGRNIFRFDDGENTLLDSEEVAVLDNTKPLTWKVRKTDGTVMEVPSICIWLPPPDTESGEVALVIRKKLLNAWAALLSKSRAWLVSCYTAYLRSLGHGSVFGSFLNHLERASGDILIDVEGRQQLMNALRVVRNNLVACETDGHLKHWKHLREQVDFSTPDQRTLLKETTNVLSEFSAMNQFQSDSMSQIEELQARIDEWQFHSPLSRASSARQSDVLEAVASRLDRDVSNERRPGWEADRRDMLTYNLMSETVQHSRLSEHWPSSKSVTSCATQTDVATDRDKDKDKDWSKHVDAFSSNAHQKSVQPTHSAETVSIVYSYIEENEEEVKEYLRQKCPHPIVNATSADWTVAKDEESTDQLDSRQSFKVATSRQPMIETVGVDCQTELPTLATTELRFERAFADGNAIGRQRTIEASIACKPADRSLTRDTESRFAIDKSSTETATVNLEYFTSNVLVTTPSLMVTATGTFIEDEIIEVPEKAKQLKAGVPKEPTKLIDACVGFQQETVEAECQSFVETPYIESTVQAKRTVSDSSSHENTSSLELEYEAAGIQVKQAVSEMGSCEQILTADGGMRYKDEPKLKRAPARSSSPSSMARLELRPSSKRLLRSHGAFDEVLTADGGMRYKDEPKLEACASSLEFSFEHGSARAASVVKEASVQVNQPVGAMGAIDKVLTADGGMRYKDEPKLEACASSLELEYEAAGIQVKQAVSEMGSCEQTLTADGGMRYKDEPKLEACASSLEFSFEHGSARAASIVKEASVQVNQPVGAMGAFDEVLTADGGMRYKDEPKLEACASSLEFSFEHGSARAASVVKEASVQVNQPVGAMGAFDEVLTADGGMRYKDEPKLEACASSLEFSFEHGSARAASVVKEASVQVNQPVGAMGAFDEVLTADGGMRYKDEPKLEACASSLELEYEAAGIQVKQAVSEMGSCEQILTADGGMRYKDEPKLEACASSLEFSFEHGSARAASVVKEASVQVNQPVGAMGAFDEVLTADGGMRYKDEPKLEACASSLELEYEAAGIQVKQAVSEMGSCEQILTADGGMRYKDEPKLEACASSLEFSFEHGSARAASVVKEASVQVNQPVGAMGAFDEVLTADGGMRYKDEPKLEACASSLELEYEAAGIQVKQAVSEMGSCEQILTADGGMRYKDEPKLEACASSLEFSFEHGSARAASVVKEASVQVNQPVGAMGAFDEVLTADGGMRYKDEPKLEACASSLEFSFEHGSARAASIVKEASVQVNQPVGAMGAFDDEVLTADGGMRYKDEPKLKACASSLEFSFEHGSARAASIVKEASVQVHQPVGAMGAFDEVLTADGGGMRYKDEPKLEACASSLEFSFEHGSARAASVVKEASVQVNQPVGAMGAFDEVLTADGGMRYKDEPKLEACASSLEFSFEHGSARAASIVKEASVQVNQPVGAMGAFDEVLTADGGMRYKDEPKLEACASSLELEYEAAGIQVKQAVSEMGSCEQILTAGGHEIQGRAETGSVRQLARVLLRAWLGSSSVRRQRASV
uniref:SH3_10 domain-containing protein n=2 Tax=Macrostomum lignano TaxID=282301 RepID=A0A1I8G8R5_9PLAT